LSAHLDQAVVLPRGVDHLAAFPDVVREGLLHIDVLAGLAGPDRAQAVPVVHRGVGHRVDVLPVEQTPHVDVLVDLAAGLGGERPGRGLQPGAVGVAEGHDRNTLQAGKTGDMGPGAADPQAHNPMRISSLAPRTRDEATMGKATEAAAAADLFSSSLRLMDIAWLLGVRRDAAQDSRPAAAAEESEEWKPRTLAVAARQR